MATDLRLVTYCGLYCELCAARGRIPRQANALRETMVKEGYDVWGKDVRETIRIFKERYGEKDLSVSTIGRAGENQVRYAAWVNEDDRAFGRGGTGAVGGSKQLKAIVIRGARKKSQVADADAWKPVNVWNLQLAPAK